MSKVDLSLIKDHLESAKIAQFQKVEQESKEKALTLLSPVEYQLHKLDAVNWVVPGFLPEGLVMIAGEPGVGKTTAIVSVCAAVAHLTQYEGIARAKYFRKVVYLTEDPHQVINMLYGITKHNKLNPDLVKERFIVIEAIRSKPETLAKALEDIAEKYWSEYFVDSVSYEDLDNTTDLNIRRTFKIPPLVVFDTASSLIELESENNNSEVGKAMAQLKTKVFRNNLPLWIAGHTPKASKGNEGKGLSARGASAFEGDVQTMSYIYAEGHHRIFSLGKRRFVPEFTDIEYTVENHQEVVTDRYGDIQTAFYSIASLARSNKTVRKEEAKQAAEESKIKAAEIAVLTFVAHYDYTGKPLTRTVIQDHLRGPSNTDKTAAINNLLAAGHLAERDVPVERKQSGPKKPELVLGSTYD
jgi:hypothetical protein